MDDEVLTIGLINLAAGVLALTIAHLYGTPRTEISSVPFAITTVSDERQ